MIKQQKKNLKKHLKAYHVLSNPERKQNYDNFGHAAFENTGGGRGGFSNFDFSIIFQIYLRIFLEKVLGVEEEVEEQITEDQT